MSRLFPSGRFFESPAVWEDRSIPRGGTLLASTKFIRRRAPGHPGIRRAAGALILGAISFNAVLAFLNTRGVAVSGAHVIASEILLIGAAVVVCRNYLTPVSVSIMALFVSFAMTLGILRYASMPPSGFDPKIIRDILIPVVFFLLGKAVSDIKAADRVVFVALGAVLVFAAFEYFFLDAYLRLFGVAEYYVARGSLDPADPALAISQGFMASGVRPTDQGRFLLPFLGTHRVSSLFLEPSTLGNFGALVTAWAVVRSRMEGRFYAGCVLGGLALVVLSDTRFNAYFLTVAVAMMALPPRVTTLFVFVLPLVLVLALYLLAALGDPYHGIPIVEGREVGDRLLYSGRVLFEFDLYNWLGLKVSPAQTFDSGYGYVIANLGLIGAVAFWIVFMSLEGLSRDFLVFRNLLAVYFSALLCISSSQFTIKLAALLWFLLGVLATVPGKERGAALAQAVAATGAIGKGEWDRLAGERV